MSKILPTEQPARTKNGVLIYADGANYSDSFGYEWEKYRNVYIDSLTGSDLSLNRIELNLGFPIEFLKGLTILEVGCGAGRYTEHFVKHAKSVVAFDYSDAIFHNVALGASNLTAMKADVTKLPKFSEPFDLVFCRGVLQHTKEPKKSLEALFKNAKDGGLVIFDWYRKNPKWRRSFKYALRPFFQKHVPIEKFDAFFEKHEDQLYNFHHRWLSFVNSVKPLRWFLGQTPLYLAMDWEKEYGMLTRKQRVEIFKTEMIDALYAHYDQPAAPMEVINALAEIGQVPYSFDLYRNHFRCRKNPSMTPMKIMQTKNGIFRRT